ncbi:putative RING-H2 finger protein [Nymphaea thermarum]|nr:putative RING-H2 finger protein [Nymphaea thermarum]
MAVNGMHKKLVHQKLEIQAASVHCTNPNWDEMLASYCKDLTLVKYHGVTNNSGNQGRNALPERSAGIGRELIASLPLCTFSLHGRSRLGLECSICLSKFEDMDALHVLPRCNHAFNVTCIDAWLEKHLSCPLCRQPVEADDVFNFDISVASQLRCSENMQELNEGIGTKVCDHGKAGSSDPHRCRISNAAALMKDQHQRPLNMRSQSSVLYFYDCKPGIGPARPRLDTRNMGLAGAELGPRFV